MKMFWKKLHLGREFSVLYAGRECIYGGKFHRKNKTWKLASFAVEKIDEKNPAAAWKKVFRSVGKAEFCAVTGNVDGNSFFRFTSADMDSRAQRGAVEFELPRQLLKVPEKPLVQFCVSGRPADDPGSVTVNAVVFPEDKMAEFIRNMNDAGVQVDEFIHPFMAVDDESAVLMLPEIEPDFIYAAQSWMPMPDAEEVQKNRQHWIGRLAGIFDFSGKSGFDADEFLPLLLVAKVIVSGKLQSAPDAFRVLPDSSRLVRFRGHLTLTAILLVALVGTLIWRFYNTYGMDIREYRAVNAEIKSLKQKTSELKSSNKRSSKDLKEMSRIIAMEVGEADAVAEFALLSETLPLDVLVSSVRWNETDIDVSMQCENTQLDLPALIAPLKYWKVGSVQQSQHNDSPVATINLKLIPYDAKVMK